VVRLNGVQEVAGSNPAGPMLFFIGKNELDQKKVPKKYQKHEFIGRIDNWAVTFNEKWCRFATQMRDFRTIDIAGLATRMIPVLRPGFNWNSPISLIGVRAALEASPAENRTDIYDDIILRC